MWAPQKSPTWINSRNRDCYTTSSTWFTLMTTGGLKLSDNTETQSPRSCSSLLCKHFLDKNINHSATWIPCLYPPAHTLSLTHLSSHGTHFLDYFLGGCCCCILWCGGEGMVLISNCYTPHTPDDDDGWWFPYLLVPGSQVTVISKSYYYYYYCYCVDCDRVDLLIIKLRKIRILR